MQVNNASTPHSEYREQSAPKQGDRLSRTASAPNIVVISDLAPNWLAQALDNVMALLQRYVIFAEPAQAIAISLWVAHCWTIDAFDYTPYLHISSPVKRCGKSRLFDCLDRLCPKPWSVVSVTEAVLFRKIDKDCPTLLLDELDKLGEEAMERICAVLNAGFERGAVVPRCVGPQHALREFRVFCPKAFAGINNRKLPDTVSDRSIPIVMARRRRDQTRERFRAREAEPIAGPIRTALETWRKDQSTISSLRDARPIIPEQLGDRAADICEPLLAIGDMAGGRWRSMARSALVKLCGEDEGEEEIGIQLLGAIRQIFEEKNHDHILTADLLDALAARDDGPWPGWWEKDLRNGNTRGPGARLARLVKQFGIMSKNIRADGGVAKGYTLESFDEAFARYLPLQCQRDATTL
jgi:hypothetical protein